MSNIVLPEEGSSGLKHCNQRLLRLFAHECLHYTHKVFVQSSAQETGCLRSELLEIHVHIC